jgi:pilus assembly protein CpaE
MHSEFMGFIMDDDSLVVLRGWAERQGYPQASVQQGGPDMFAQMLESAAPPKMAMVDIDGHADAAATISRLVSLCGGDCRLIAVGSANDIALYRRIQNAGAIDYVVKPLMPDMLNHALAAALRSPSAHHAKPEDKQAREIVVIGARGGVGASAVALNTGWLMAHEMGLNVALFDLDLQFGSSFLALDLEPGRGLRDIVSSPNRVDSLMIASSIVPESENFSVLGAEETVDEMVPIDGGAITALLKEMKSNFDVIIVDMPRHMLAAHKRPLMGAHEIVIVSDLSLAGIRDSLRIKTALTSLGSSARMSIVASRTDASGRGQINADIFEKGVQAAIAVTIPEDAAGFAAASNSGKAMGHAAAKSPATKALRELAQHLVNENEPVAPKKSFLDKLFSDKKKKKPDSGRGHV